MLLGQFEKDQTPTTALDRPDHCCRGVFAARGEIMEIVGKARP
jgi:hypothetical protein